jgi:hypothetical protein
MFLGKVHSSKMMCETDPESLLKPVSKEQWFTASFEGGVPAQGFQWECNQK